MKSVSKILERLNLAAVPIAMLLFVPCLFGHYAATANDTNSVSSAKPSYSALAVGDKPDLYMDANSGSKEGFPESVEPINFPPVDPLSEGERRWISKHPEVAFTGDPNWLPYEAFREDGKYVGIVADHLKLIEKRTGLKFKPVPVSSWTESLQIAIEGKVSVISGDAADAVLNRQFNPVETYSRNPIVIIMNSRQHYVEKLGEIKDRKIAIIKDYGYTADIFRYYPDFDFIEVKNIQEGLEGVSQGRFDALLATMALASYTMAEMGLHNIKVVGKTPIIMDLTLFVSKDQPVLHSIIDKTLKSIPGSESQDILQSWIRNKYVEKTDYRLALSIATALLLILAIILIWNHRLRVEIDTRRKVELRLIESQTLLQEAQALAHVGNWELDPATMRAVWSDEVYRIFGIEYTEDVGPNCLEKLLHPDDRAAVLASLMSAVKDGCKHKMEYRIVRPDGGVRWIDCEADQLLDKNSALIKLRGVIQDITQRKLDELQLQESEERYELVLSVANDGIWDWHLDDNNVFFDTHYFAMAGYEQNEFPGRYEEWLKRIHPDDAEQAEAAVEEYLAGKRKTFDIEFRFKCKNNDYIWIRGRGRVVLRDEQGVPLRFVGTHSDITQRKLVEEKIYDSEERYRTIIEGAPTGVWLIGRDRRTLQVNKCLCDIIGYQQEEIVGRLPMEFVDEKNRKIFLEQTGKIETTETREYQIDLRHKDGHAVPTLFNATTLHKRDGDILAAVAFVTDLTEQRISETALRRAQKMDAVGQMAGGIAHDFNNILGVILGNLDLLERQIGNDDKLRKLISTIERSSQRAADLTKQLLGFSCKQASETTITDINRVVREMESLIARSITPEVMVEHRFAEDLWLTEIDLGDFQDALLNLVLNARDAMPSGGQLTLETCNCTLDAAYCARNPSAKPGEYVRLSVSDTGKGIPLDQQEHIFEPFYSTKTKGTGLGLAMVYGFIERSQAHVRVESNPGVGAKFLIHIPRAHGEEQLLEAGKNQNGALPHGTETILVVDDELDLLELSKEALQLLGYQVRTACDGQQAIAQLLADPAIAVLFTDIVMPGGMNGYELAERAMSIRPDLKILLTSGYTDKAASHKAHARVSASLIGKPYSLEEIANRIRTLLEDKRPSVIESFGGASGDQEQPTVGQ